MNGEFAAGEFVINVYWPSRQTSLADRTECASMRARVGAHKHGAWRAPELFEPNLLLKFYSRAELESELARRIFVLPRSGTSLGQSRPSSA